LLFARVVSDLEVDLLDQRLLGQHNRDSEQVLRGGERL
jgi:hypothetical protein